MATGKNNIAKMKAVKKKSVLKKDTPLYIQRKVYGNVVLLVINPNKNYLQEGRPYPIWLSAVDVSTRKK